MFIYLRLEEEPPPPGLGCWSLYRWRLRLHGPAWWQMIFSIAFMFSTIYLRLGGKVPPTRIDNGFFKHEYYRFHSSLVMDFFPIAFMFSPIDWKTRYPLPRIEIGLNMNAIENKSFHLRSASAFYNLPSPSITLFYP